MREDLAVRDDAPPPSPVASRLDRLPVSIRWAIYIFGVLAGGAGMVAAVVALFGATLSGGWLVLLFAFMLVLFTLVTWLLAAHFDRLFVRLTKETNDLRGQMNLGVTAASSVDFTLSIARRLNDEIANLNHQDVTTGDVLVFIQRACDGLRDAFDHGMGLQTRVCVKQVGAGFAEAPYVTDVYRTNESVDRTNAHHHPIDQNTDFQQLVRRQKKYWFTGNRSEYVDYMTTSINPKYESVIVWPIIPRVSPEAGSPPLNTQRVRAFLCLDSEVANAFSEKRDVAVGWMVADTLARAYENTQE